MRSILLVLLFGLISFITSGELVLTEEDYKKAIPGHMFYEQDFQKLLPNVPKPSSNLDSRIVGGEESVPHSRRYQAALYTPRPTGTSFCGGSLINARTVLTAAHCVDNRIGNVTIFLGAHNMPPGNDSNVIEVSSGDIAIHPLWNTNIISNDIALVRFDTAVPLNANITPILLPRDSTQDYLGNTTITSGWGRFSDNVTTISPVLREVSSFVISNYACRLAFLGTVSESNICVSGGSGRNPCNGDSGGALVINGVQVGVTSFVSSWGCAQGWPSAFARVTHYLDWIRTNEAIVL